MKKQRLSGALAGAIVIGALLVGSPGASASLPTSQAHSTASSSVQVRLITGDIVLVRTDASGRQMANVVSAHRQGAAGIFRSFTLGHDVFVVPQSAAPYLGHQLDPSLFDVTALARHPQSSLHVDVTLRPGAGAARLPGATLHRVSPTQAAGSFSVRSARVFGDALAGHAGPDLFRGISRISSGGVHPADCPTGPNTLTVKGVNWNGDPDTGDSVNLYSVDDIAGCNLTLTFAGGQAQVDVPDGNYSLVSFFFDGANANIYLVSIPQVSVTKDTTVTLDATTATSAISVSTPKPAAQPVFIVEWVRSDALGQTGSYTFSASDFYTFYAAPTNKAPSIGEMHLAVQIRAQSEGAKTPYEYDAKFHQDGTIKADQSYQVKSSDLMTINTGIATDTDGQLALDGRFAAYQWEFFLFVGDLQFPLPTSRTEYYTAGDDLTWQRFEFTVWDPSIGLIQGEVDGPWERYTAGRERTEVFSGEPTHPRLYEHAITDWISYHTICPACATPTSLDALVFPFGDNSQFHRGYPSSPGAGLNETLNWSIKADKKVIGQGSGFFQASVPLDPHAKTYTLSYKTHRTGDHFSLSTDANTVWTVQADAPQADLPDGWVCSGNGDSNCSVLPLMTNGYDLGADLLGRIASGDHKGSVALGHLANPVIRFKHVKVAFSYDGGKTWRPATVTRGDNGHFAVAYTVPAKGQTDGFGAVRFSAHDAVGGSLKQTILRAFAVK